MIKDIHSLSLLDILPDNLLADEQVAAAAQALDGELQAVTAATIETLHLPRIDVLPEKVLDILAWQWHVDFYEPLGMSAETKRKLIRKSIAWHRMKGTPAIVEDIVTDIFKKSIVKEWFEYDGIPYSFRVIVEEMPTSRETVDRLIRAIKSVKNVRSWLEMVVYQPEKNFYLNCGGSLVDVITPEKVIVKHVPYIAFAYGLNATGTVETLTNSETATTNHSAYLFTSSTTNGRLRINDTSNYSLEEKDLGQDVTEHWKVFIGSRLNAKSAIETNDTPTASRSSTYHIADWQNVVTYHGDTLNGGTGARRTWTTSKTMTSSEKRFVRPIYALNQLGTLSKSWEDIGSDKTITETIFDGTYLNGGKADVETKTISATSSRNYTVFTGACLNGRKNLFLNQSNSEQKTKETVTTRTIKTATFTGALLNGVLNLNRSKTKTITRTVRIPVWREVHKRKGSTLLNASRHEMRYKEIRTVITPRKVEKKFDPAIGTLLNSKAVMGYLRLS